MAEGRRRPLDVLHQHLDKRVIVHCRGRREYRGILYGYDHPHFNLLVKEAEEVLRHGTENETTSQHKLVFIRGDTVVYVSP